jgi:hypothetical protein
VTVYKLSTNCTPGTGLFPNNEGRFHAHNPVETFNKIKMTKHKKTWRLKTSHQLAGENQKRLRGHVPRLYRPNNDAFLPSRIGPVANSSQLDEAIGSAVKRIGIRECASWKLRSAPDKSQHVSAWFTATSNSTGSKTQH